MQQSRSAMAQLFPYAFPPKDHPRIAPHPRSLFANFYRMIPLLVNWIFRLLREHPPTMTSTGVVPAFGSCAGCNRRRLGLLTPRRSSPGVRFQRLRQPRRYL